MHAGRAVKRDGAGPRAPDPDAPNLHRLHRRKAEYAQRMVQQVGDEKGEESETRPEPKFAFPGDLATGGTRSWRRSGGLGRRSHAAWLHALRVPPIVSARAANMRFRCPRQLHSTTWGARHEALVHVVETAPQLTAQGDRHLRHLL